MPATKPLASPLQVLAQLHARLPQRPLSELIALALNAARRLQLLPQDLSSLEGKCIGVRVTDLGLSPNIRILKGRFGGGAGADHADVCFSASLSDFACLLRGQEDPDTLFFQRRLRIEGDTELGLLLKNLLAETELPAWLLARLPRA